jgi:hypothetical protein
MKILELLDAPEKWTKKTAARGASGSPLPPDSDQACCWCILGALQKCYPKGPADVEVEVLLKAIEKIFPRTGTLGLITRFNDHPDTTFADVRAVLEEANV